MEGVFTMAEKRAEAIKEEMKADLKKDYDEKLKAHLNCELEDDLQKELFDHIVGQCSLTLDKELEEHIISLKQEVNNIKKQETKKEKPKREVKTFGGEKNE